MRAIALAVILTGDAIVNAVKHVPDEPNVIRGLVSLVFLICLILGK